MSLRFAVWYSRFSCHLQHQQHIKGKGSSLGSFTSYTAPYQSARERGEDGSSVWIPETHMGVQMKYLVCSFSLTQPWLLSLGSEAVDIILISLSL